ncbi:MAG: VanZ family protein [Gammaproteobacteria bacterium]|nr:VanZ family protein [Gammaproteobacteria bacterium]MCK5262402.1 VanZ family protein [Gammaproteobacteria bacterium]
MMQEINPTYRYYKLWLAMGYALVTLVIYLSVTSNPPDPGIEMPNFDKVAHTLAYFAMMGWFAQIYHVKKQRIIYALSFVALGVALEFVQSFDSRRMAEFADMVANTSGVLIAVLITRMSAFRLVLKRVESYI